ncbi:UPF0738 family protein [Rummeliibacillus pycnus]|uniref:UPF0738 family protein n=1 Tax=Rummeliibacillus pycnus TaxID=101070 RepID=UPI000C9BB791|nr:hypothetical protein [Rummeliibacillus pycnus]
MRKTFIVEKGTKQDSHIHFYLNENSSDIKCHPTGQMITDSDDMAFVYLMDEEDGYSYVKFPQTVWPLLVETLQSKVNPMLQWNTEQIELIKFNDELQSLIYNIEGNYNYGEVFTTAVEETFAELLSEA